MQEDNEISDVTPINTYTKSIRSYITYQGGYSLTGRRDKNEDYYHIDGSQALWIVSDGIGGAPFGEVMSRVACNYFARIWSDVEFEEVMAEERLIACLQKTDSFLSDLSDLLGGMGSGATFTVACYVEGTVNIASVGDSRAYLLRGGAIHQMSGGGRANVHSNALDQALGYHMELRPNMTVFVPEPADILLLCTDGVWSTQSHQMLISSLTGDLQTNREISEDGNPQRMAYKVVEESDMSDNATAVVVLFTNETTTGEDERSTSSETIDYRGPEEV